MNQSKDPMRDKIFLGALLHDIGKFYQRADKNFSDKGNTLSEYSKRMAEDICPINDYGKFGYQHVVWTNEFFEKREIKDKLAKVPGLKENLYYSDNSGEDNLFNFACNHHKPKSRLQSIITLADWWSAGIDRTSVNTHEKDESKNEDIDWGKARYKKIPLFSIFNSIMIDENKLNHSNAFPLNALDINNRDSLFPKRIAKEDDGINEESYNNLWLSFIKEFSSLPHDSCEGFLESLLYLLKKYTWCIPSNTMDMANVSLYEHLKTTAAFADCFYTFMQENEEAFLWNSVNYRLHLAEQFYPVLLIGGDISGIQKFLFNVSSKKAATSLKGRSFYVQMLIDSIIHKIIYHPEITATIGHVIYSSGGKFYMILPNTHRIIEALKFIIGEIESELWDVHKGKLVFNFDYIPFAYNSDSILFEGNEEKSLGGLWKALADKLTLKKNQKFKNHITDNIDTFFEIIPSGGNIGICSVTGIEYPINELVNLKANKDEPDIWISKAVSEQIAIGTVLKDVDYLICHKAGSSKYLSNRLKHETIIAGIGNYLFDQLELIRDDSDFRSITSTDVAKVIKINNSRFLDAQIKGQKVSYGFQFYGGNKQAPFDKNRDKTFEELAINDKGDPTFLAILRMDVDSLGNIFINGFDNRTKSFAAYSTLSFLLDTFFSGYLNTIREKYSDYVNILYSGGDDVFAVGRWDKIISFASDICEEFRKFVGRDDITISAGIAIVDSKFPISKAAKLAEEAENKAKSNVVNRLKNAINFFGETVSWDIELTFVKTQKETFKSLIENSGMSKAILHQIMLWAEIKRKNELYITSDESFKPDLSYRWNMVYSLTRLSDRYKNKPEIKEFVDRLRNELFPDKTRYYELMALAARWAEFELKES